MLYTYTTYFVYKEYPSDEEHVRSRRSIGVTFDKVDPIIFEVESNSESWYEVEVSDNRTNELKFVIRNLDDYLIWQEKLEKDFAWKPVKREVKSDNLTDNNLKTLAAANKPKMSAIPPIAILALGSAMQDGADKYGRFNWRDTTVSSTVFFDAIMRHLVLWYLGEDHAKDSKVHHLAHVMAGAAILLDGELSEVRNDDRDARTANKTLEDMMNIIKNG